MILTIRDFGNTKCVECKSEKATMLLKLGGRKDGYFLCDSCERILATFLDKKIVCAD